MKCSGNQQDKVRGAFNLDLWKNLDFVPTGLTIQSPKLGHQNLMFFMHFRFSERFGIPKRDPFNAMVEALSCIEGGHVS